MSLPSRYAPAGMSKSQQNRTITIGKPRENRPIGVVKLEGRVEDAVKSERVQTNIAPKVDIDGFDLDGDIPMLGMDDDFEVTTIANYVTDKRNAGELDDSVDVTLASIEDDIETSPVGQLNTEIYFVVDTNFILSHLDMLDDLRKLHGKFNHKIIIPMTTMSELDGLKSSGRFNKNHDGLSGQSVGHLARWANDWLYRHLAESDSAIRGQQLKEKMDINAIKDDSILDCCVYFQTKMKGLVILLSNDKNFCMKALTNGILTISFRKKMSARMIAEKAHEESLVRFGGSQLTEKSKHTILPPELTTQGKQVKRDSSSSSHLVKINDFDTACEQVYMEIQAVVLSALDHCMHEEYGDDLEMIGYDKSRIMNLRQSSEALIRFWMTVFSNYFKGDRNRDPFKGQRRGRKVPAFVEMPRTSYEFKDFVKYWCDILEVLYVGREEKQIDALNKLIERWVHISTTVSD